MVKPLVDPLTVGVGHREACDTQLRRREKMQTIACLLCLLPLQTYAVQEEDKWQRLYSFDTATVDISTTNIWFGSDFTGRVRFRLMLSKPERVSGNGKATYQVVIETMELRCDQRQYRVVDVKRYDRKGKLVDAGMAQPASAWKAVESGGMMDKYIGPGCDVVYKKKQNP
jgi:hypothetical protein